MLPQLQLWHFFSLLELVNPSNDNRVLLYSFFPTLNSYSSMRFSKE
jgi:hypothetical protein